MLADPVRFSCVTLRDGAEGLLAFYALERDGQFNRVPLLRICSHRLAGTLARSILTEMNHQAARDGQNGVVVADTCADDELRAAFADLGFLPLQGGWAKLVVPGLLLASQLAERIENIGLADPVIAQLIATLRSPLDQTTASRLEHLLSPGKIADVDVPAFIVPIQPDYAPGSLRREPCQAEALRGGS